jgi:hypothetical protein
MKTFTVTVRTADSRYQYTAMQHSAIDAHLDAIDRFGVCAITVRPA